MECVYRTIKKIRSICTFQERGLMKSIKPEHSKATAKIINSLIKGNFSLLDVGSQTGHFLEHLKEYLKLK